MSKASVIQHDVFENCFSFRPPIFEFRARRMLPDPLKKSRTIRAEEKAMAPHSSTFAWRIPWTEEPGGLQSMGLLESDTTERLHFHFSLPCIGEGNGNPLQCSCLENPKDGGAWWAAIYGVAQSRTRLKRLSSSSSIHAEIEHYTRYKVKGGKKAVKCDSYGTCEKKRCKLLYA